MTCEDALILLSGHLDGVNTREEEAELLAHLQHCSDCRALLEALEAADAGIQALEAEPPAELSERILAAVRKEPRHRKHTRPWMIPVATAAALAIVVWAGIRTLPRMGSATTAANAALTQMARADTTTTDTATEETCSADAAVPEAYFESDAMANSSEAPAEQDVTADSAGVDLEGLASALSRAETAAVLVLDADDASLAAYDGELLPEGVYRVQLSQEAWEALQAAHPDAAVFQPDGTPAVYYVIHP